MAFTLSQLQKLEQAVAMGATRVEYEDKEVEYRSLADMLQLIGLMKRELGLTAGTTIRRRATFSKGLCE